MTFEDAFKRTLGHEGGYVNDPADPGGETKFGISKRAYPNEDIADLTLKRAQEIYLADYWRAVRADEMPPAIRYPLFDAAVNHGPKAARRMLQRAVQTEDDGVFGPMTLQAVSRCRRRPRDLVHAFQAQRLLYFAGIAQRSPETFARFGRGWMSRTLKVFAEALSRHA